MCVELVFQANKARQWVNQKLGSPIERTTFFRWRKFLNMLDTPYTFDDLNALVYFGQCVQAGATLDQARQQTIKHLRSKTNVN